MNSAPGRVHLELADQARIAALAQVALHEASLTLALCPAVAVHLSRCQGPLYERVEAAYKQRARLPSPLQRARVERYWELCNDLHGYLLLSLRDLAQSKARAAERQLERAGFGQHDLFSIAELGALRGIRRYDPGRGTQLGMFTKSWILKALRAEADAIRNRPGAQERFHRSLTEDEPDARRPGGQRDVPDPTPPAWEAEEERLELEAQQEQRRQRLAEALVWLRREDPEAADHLARHFRLKGASRGPIHEDIVRRGYLAIFERIRG